MVGNGSKSRKGLSCLCTIPKIEARRSRRVLPAKGMIWAALCFPEHQLLTSSGNAGREKDSIPTQLRLKVRIFLHELRVQLIPGTKVMLIRGLPYLG